MGQDSLPMKRSTEFEEGYKLGFEAGRRHGHTAGVEETKAVVTEAIHDTPLAPTLLGEAPSDANILAGYIEDALDKQSS